jgi:hypothetical protein
MSTGADRIVGFVKLIATLKYLALNIASPVVNLTSMFVTLPASLAQYTKYSGAFKNKDGKEFDIKIPPMKLRHVPVYIGKALQMFVAYKWGDKKSLPPEVIRLFDDVAINGWARAQFNEDVLAWLQSKPMRIYRKAINISMYLFSVSEQINRVASIGSAFIYMAEQAKRQGVILDNKTIDTLAEHAKGVSDWANGQYGDIGTPYLAQGDNIGANVLRSGYTFLKFPHTVLMQLHDLTKLKNYKAAAWLVMAPTILAGVGANPLYNIAMQPLMWLWKKLFQTDDPEQGFYDFMQANFGIGEWVKEGVFDKTTGLSIKRSLAIDIPSITNSIPSSLYRDIKNGATDIWNKQYGRAGEAIAPRLISAPMRAYREAKEGITSTKSVPQFYGKERIKPTVPQVVARGLGFTPLAISQKQEAIFRGKQVQKNYADMKSAINERYRKYFLVPVDKRDRKDLVEIMKDVKKFNDRIVKNNLQGSIGKINQTTLSRARNIKPTRYERMRETREENK